MKLSVTLTFPVESEDFTAREKLAFRIFLEEECISSAGAHHPDEDYQNLVQSIRDAGEEIIAKYVRSEEE